MLDGRGFIAETNATHVFVVSDGVVATSRLVACPEGVTRATVLELCGAYDIPHREADLSLAAAYRADEIFCTGTMGELAAVVELDGRVIGDGKAGPLTRRLTELYGELTAVSGDSILADDADD